MNKSDLDLLFGGHYESMLAIFTQTPDLLAVFLFGSQVDGFADKNSDIDLAVLFSEPPTLQDEMTLSGAISQLLQSDRVDFLFLNRASLTLRHRACSGILLYEHDPLQVSDFIEDTIEKYVDYLPDLKQYYEDYDHALEEAYGI